jgi:hypothetical protein
MYEISSGNRNRLKKYLILLTLIILIAAGFSLWQHKQQTKSPVPANIQKAVPYQIYYPDKTRLPQGYYIDQTSFANPVKNGVTYSVVDPSNRKLVFSLQQRPSDNDLTSFYGSYIPVKIELDTDNGKAESGIYNQKSLISLPIRDGPWVIITAPKDINQAQLKQILSSLKK